MVIFVSLVFYHSSYSCSLIFLFFFYSYFYLCFFFFFFSSRRRHTRWTGDWSSDVCSSDLAGAHERRTGSNQPMVRLDGLRTAAAACATSSVVTARIRSGAAMMTSTPAIRSEERRVGKECRSRWAPYH